MPRNVSGVYTLPAGNPVVPASVIATTWANPTMSDLGNEITNSLDRAGRGAMTAQLKIVDGTVGVPGIGFNSETTTGLWRQAAGVMAATVLGATVWAASAGQLGVVAGTAAAPGLSVIGDLNSGMYSSGADTLDWSVAGNQSLQLTATGLKGIAGTAGDPSWSFIADPNTGIYSAGADILGFATNGAFRLQIGTTRFLANLPWEGQDGTAAAPAFTFSVDNNTGAYRVGADIFGISAAGSLVASFQSSSVRMHGATQGALGVLRPGASPSGTTANSNYDELVIDANANSGITILTGNVSTGALVFGDADDSVVAGLFYDHSTDELEIWSANTARQILAGTSVRFFGATNGVLGVVDGTASGQSANAGADSIVVDSTGNSGMTFLSANTAIQAVYFGDTDDATAAGLAMLHSTNVFRVQSSVGNVFVRHSDVAADIPIGFRNLPIISNAATATAVAVGKCYLNTGDITINNSVFAAGDIFCVYNNSGSSINIIDGTITTMRLAGTATTGTRALAQRGMATLFFPTATECVVSGSGVT